MAETLRQSRGMRHHNDIDVQTAMLLALKHKRILEIGTFRGASSEPMLRLLPKVEVISIACISQARGKRQFNNDELTVAKVGALVSAADRAHYTHADR